MNPGGIVDLSGRPDGVHFDTAAAEAIAAWLVPQLDLSERAVN